jgi:cysteine-rich repeat protein
MTNPRLRTMLVLLGATLASATPAAAQTSQVCASAKLKAIGKTAASAFNCYSKAAKLGIAVDPACIQKAEDKWNFPLKGAFQKAELKGGCAIEGQNFVLDGRCSGNGTTVCNVVQDCPSLGTCSIHNDDTEAQALYDLVVDENLTVEKDTPLGVIDTTIPSLIPVPATGNACQSNKVKATGKLAASLLNCWSKAAKTDTPIDQACLTKATTKHTAAFAKSELKPPCDTNGDAATVQADVAPFVELAVHAIPRRDGCGSGVVLAPETCDDGNITNTDSCPSDCTIATCTPNSGSDDPHTVSFSSTKNVAAISVFVDYPEDKISIPGSGSAIPIGIIDNVIGDPFTAASFNDQDHGLTGVLAEGTGGNFGLSGDLFQVHYETCMGAGAATAGDFTCTVIQAADALGKPLKGVTCTVN